MKLLAIDGNSILNRSFYGVKLLSAKNGTYTNALVGFLNILLKMIHEITPDEIVVAFDLHAPTFRHKMYADYKGTRKGMPEELQQQMPLAKKIITMLGYSVLELEGYEEMCIRDRTKLDVSFNFRLKSSRKQGKIEIIMIRQGLNKPCLTLERVFWRIAKWQSNTYS